MAKPAKRVAVTGAAGQIAYSLLQCNTQHNAHKMAFSRVSNASPVLEIFNG